MVGDLVFDGVGDSPVPGTARAQAVIVTGHSTGTIQDSIFRSGGGINAYESSAPVIEGNRFEDGPAIYGDYGDGTIIRENTFTGPGAFGVRLGEPAEVLVEGNEITDREYGIDTVNGMGPATIKGNAITGATTAVSADSSTGQVVDNVLTDNVIGISWSGEGGDIENNTVNEGMTGIIIGAGTAYVRDNTVGGTENRGMLVYHTAVAELSGNTLCGNKVNLEVVDGADVTEVGSNEVCEDAPAE